MFLALYFATEETPEVAVNDNREPFAGSWYAQALASLADSNREWNTAHAAALAGGPLG